MFVYRDYPNKYHSESYWKAKLRRGERKKRRTKKTITSKL